MRMEKLFDDDVDIGLDSGVSKVKKGKMHCCKKCDAKFVRKNHLERHELVHSKEKHHRCGICEKTFARVDNTRRHEKLCRRTTTRGLNPGEDILQTSSGDIAVPVPVSGDAVNLGSGVIDRSSSTRKSKKTYRCRYCEKTLSSYQSLRRHEKTCKKAVLTVEPPFVADELTTPYMELENLLMDHARVYWENVEKGRMVDDILRKGGIPVEALPREFIDARALWLSGQ